MISKIDTVNEEIINRVAQSPIITIDLHELPIPKEREVYDLKSNLYEGLILKEKDFRLFVKENDWARYKDKYVAIHCSADAIIPNWVYMILASKIAPYAKSIVFGNGNDLEEFLIINAIQNLEPSQFKNKKVVIKGCGEKEISSSAYLEITKHLLPHVSSIMYGEPCSTVPVFKKSAT